MIFGVVIGFWLGFVVGWVICAYNATTPCPDCNEGVAKPCGDEKK